jgi:hypothetical protein
MTKPAREHTAGGEDGLAGISDDRQRLCFALALRNGKDPIGESGLAQFRETLARRGVKLMLDFLANHTAPDHPWVMTHPDCYAQGDETALARAPQLRDG